MDKRVEQIITLIDAICAEIVVPLKGKVINKPAFSELLELMGELQELLHNEKNIPKELVEILFHLYTQLDMQASYVNTEEVKQEFKAYLTKMRSNMRGIFGKRTQQNAGVKETSLKDIMESSGITTPQEVIDELKKLYD